MILRRFKEHIKAENWFAVSVDFLVVVVGIFIGMQVTDWNDERSEKKELFKLLTKLDNENKNTVELYHEYIEDSDSLTKTMKAYYYHLQNPTQFERPDKNELLKNLCRNGIMSSIIFDVPVMDKVLETGYLNHLPTTELQDAIQRYRSRKLATEDVFERLAPVTLNTFRNLYSYQNQRPSEDRNSLGGCDFQFNTFEQNPQARFIIAKIQRLHMAHEGSAELAMQQLSNLQSVLKQTLHNQPH